MLDELRQAKGFSTVFDRAPIGICIIELDKRYVHADGRTVNAHSTALLVRDDATDPDFIVALIEPRDELMQVREEAKEAKTAAHDLNNLLTVIFGHQELVLRTLRPDDKSRACVEAIGHAACMAAPIVHGILRPRAGHPELVDVSQLIVGMRRVIAQLVGSAKAQGNGIGLALARDTVERAGGFIEVESQLGQGATFILALPVRPGVVA